MTLREQRVRDLLAESGLDGSEGLVARLASLHEAVPEQPPEPSVELAALLANPRRHAAVTPLRRRPGRLLIAGAVAFGTVAAGGIAAAANELPPGAQSLVSDLSERYLPFTLPEPVAVPESEQGSAPDPGSVRLAPASPASEEVRDVAEAPVETPAEVAPREAPGVPGAASPAPASMPPEEEAPPQTAPMPTVSPSASPQPSPTPTAGPSPASPTEGAEDPQGGTTSEPSTTPGTQTDPPSEGSTTTSPPGDPTPSTGGSTTPGTTTDPTSGVVRGRVESDPSPSGDEGSAGTSPDASPTGSPTGSPEQTTEPSALTGVD